MPGISHEVEEITAGGIRLFTRENWCEKKENKKNRHKLEWNDGGEKNNFALLFPLSLKVICLRCCFMFSTGRITWLINTARNLNGTISWNSSQDVRQRPRCRIKPCPSWIWFPTNNQKTAVIELDGANQVKAAAVSCCLPFEPRWRTKKANVNCTNAQMSIASKNSPIVWFCL